VLPAAPQSTDREMLEWTRTGVVARQVVDDAARKLGVLAATNRQPELDLDPPLRRPPLTDVLFSFTLKLLM
jgi:hypothetical protein